MYLVRDVFRCKPGASRALAEKFKKGLPLMETMKGFKSPRILVDYVAEFWTIVLETEVENLAEFEAQMKEYSASAEMREIMKGYMDLVDGGRREIFTILQK